jgi:hypothetical protein
MSFSRLIAVALLGTLTIAGSARAQEGYPLDGTWRGIVGAAGGAQTTVVIVMKWDGKNIDGIVNPGRRATTFTAAQLNPSDWTVRFATSVADANGVAEPVVIEGVLESLGSYHRTITGTWTQGGATQPLELRRE